MKENKNIENVTCNDEKSISLCEKAFEKAFDIDKDIENIKKLSNEEGLDKLGQQILDSDLPIDKKADMYYKHCEMKNEDIERSVKTQRSIFNGKAKAVLTFVCGVVTMGTTIWLGKESDTIKSFLRLKDVDGNEDDNYIDVT